MTVLKFRSAFGGVLGLLAMAFYAHPAGADFAAAKQAEAQNDLNGMFLACKADANAGEEKCQNIVGVLYKVGRGGVDRDLDKAAGLFEKSCTGGYWKGCANLAGLLSAGKGIPKDPKKAVAYIDKAYETVGNIHADVHPAMLVRAADAYMALEPLDRLSALEGYVKYMGTALRLKSSIYGKFNVDKGAYLSQHQQQFEARKWFVTVARLRGGGLVSLGEPSPPPTKTKNLPPVGNVKFKDCPTCPEMISVPTGSFKMGDAAARPVESGVHDVAIKSPYAAGRLEVSFAEWDQCVSERGCSYKPNDQGWGRDRRPVINVSLTDAISYVKWLSAKTGKTYRLPSEAEWEYLARGGAASRWPWGAKPGDGKANCKDCGSQWGGRQSAPTGSFAGNGFGIQDVIGNVWEMTRDCKNETYVDAPTDGQPWLTGDCSFVIVRGASWDTPKTSSYTAVRNWMTTDARHELVGFRVVRELAADEVPGHTAAPLAPKPATPSSSSAQAGFANELVRCAALSDIHASAAGKSGKDELLITKEDERDKLMDGARYFLGDQAADRAFRERAKTMRAKFEATGGQSSKLRMLGDTCKSLLEDPKQRYAFWQK
jgi:formylglycine-generating enzyme required for sulfatase activity